MIDLSGREVSSFLGPYMIRPSVDDCKLIAALWVSQALLWQVIFFPIELKVNTFDGLSGEGIY